VDAHEKSWRVVVLWRLIVRSADGTRRAQSHGAGAVECALNTRNSVLELCFCRSAVSGVSFNDIARSRSATSPALSLETYPVSLLVRVFFTGALVLRALFLATFWRPALVAAVCLVRAMAKMVLSGLRLDLLDCSYCAFSTIRRSVQEKTRARRSEVAEQHALDL
jgi:hypothetical protein